MVKVRRRERKISKQWMEMKRRVGKVEEREEGKEGDGARREVERRGSEMGCN